MAYSDFKTVTQVCGAFHLAVESRIGALGAVRQIVEPSQRLLDDLDEDLDLALAIDTEKARSEMIIAPIFKELRHRYQEQGKTFSFFSGSTLNVDAALGLVGECDFILSASANQIEISAPVLTVVEAKNADTKVGLGQCAAQMVGIARFNAQAERIQPVWGAATTGDRWRLLKLEADQLIIDLKEYVIPYNLGIVLGFLNEPFETI